MIARALVALVVAIAKTYQWSHFSVASAGYIVLPLLFPESTVLDLSAAV